MAAVERHAAEGAHGRVATDAVERDVDATTIGLQQRDLCEVLLAVVDDARRTELPAERGLPLAARNRDHARASLHAELDRGRARAAGARVHEHRLAGAELRALVHGQPREMERHVDRSRVGKWQRVGHRE